MIRILTLSLATFAFGPACFAQDRLPLIINGQPTGAFAAVGIVGEASVGGFCTGTLITSTHVLTAAHCAEAILQLGSEDSGVFLVGDRVYQTAQVYVHPSYDGELFINDVAILVLNEPVVDVEPASLSEIPPNVGELVTIVGFGGQGAPEEGSDGSFGTKLVGHVIVDQVTENEFSWVYEDPSESNAAPGDSGGPVFIGSEQGLLLAGVVSSGTTANAQLGDITFNMRVDAYEPWITQVVLSTLPPEPPDEIPGPGEDPPTDSPDEDPPTDFPDDDPMEPGDGNEDPGSGASDDGGGDEGIKPPACRRPPEGNRGRPQGHAYGHRHAGRPANVPPKKPAKASHHRGPASRYAPRRPARGHPRNG